MTPLLNIDGLGRKYDSHEVLRNINLAIGAGEVIGLEVEQGRLIVVAEAVHSLIERGAAGTVNAIAHELGIDQSGASRLIKSATAAGYPRPARPRPGPAATSNDNTGHLIMDSSVSTNTYVDSGTGSPQRFENFPGDLHLGDGPPTFTNSTIA